MEVLTVSFICVELFHFGNIAKIVYFYGFRATEYSTRSAVIVEMLLFRAMMTYVITYLVSK